MPAERVSMRKIRDVLRLTHALGMSRRLVGEATGIGKTAVGEYVRRAAVAGLGWPIPDEIDDAELERRLFPPADTASCAARTEPDWSHIHAELKRRGVTLALLWQEYRAEHAQGYAYSWFCERYSDWRKRISPTMRQTHLAGEKLFVDWAGDTMPVFDPTTGEEHRAHIFVAALGASNYTYAEARWTETLPDWIGAHVNALAAIGGVPKALVPDNLKAGITKPSRYEPGINRTYQDLADHYGCVVLPARVMKPRDKAKVEVAVQIVQRFVLAKLRNRRFFSLAELNAAIRDCVTAINAKVMRRIGKSRNELLETIDRPALNALPNDALQLCGMEAGPRRARLSHRGRGPLLLGAVEADPRDGRGAHHQRDGRGLPQGPACREPCVLGGSQPAHDHHRAHAERASPLRRMDAATHDARGGQDRPGGHRAGRGDHESQAPSRAGLPIVPGHHQPGEDLRVRARRGREPARQRHRRDHLRLDQVDPAERSRQSLRQLESAGRPADPARQHPWSWLLPLTQRMQANEPCGRNGNERRDDAHASHT